MSLTRNNVQELCNFVLSKPSSVLGNKFFDCRLCVGCDVAHKADKFEPRVLALSKFRVFVLTGKTLTSLKIDRSFHLLSISGIAITKDDELLVTVDESPPSSNSPSLRKLQLRPHGMQASRLATHLLTAIKHYFPDYAHTLKACVELHPPSLLAEFSSLVLDIVPRACHSFRRTYAAMCDHYEQPYREEVSWDVEKIYTMNQIRVLRIEDFSHLLPKDLLPIVGVLQYSSYFTGVSVDGLRLPPDLIDVLLQVVRRSQSLTSLSLVNCALPKDFVSLLCSSVQQNPGLPLESIDLSKNVIDDKKGFTQLASVLPRVARLQRVSMAECGLGDKCASLLFQALQAAVSPGSSSAPKLTSLVLSGNNLKEDASSLASLVSLCPSLRVLDVRDTCLPLDKLWPALKFGGLQVERLLLGGCTIGKKPADSAQPIKEFFSMAVNLQEVSLCGTALPPELLKSMLLGLASNQQLSPFSLSLDAICPAGANSAAVASVFEASLAGVRARSISLRDNGLEAELGPIVSVLAGMRCLRRVDVGGANVHALRRSGKQKDANTLNKVLLEVVKLIGDESCVEELIVSDARLGAHLSVLLNTLGASTTLKSLDISSNEMGNFGARILCKALQLNTSLRRLAIDGNRVGADGLADIAAAMHMNDTLCEMACPVADACDAAGRADRARTMHALSQIEQCLERNRQVTHVEAANYKKVLAAMSMSDLEIDCAPLSSQLSTTREREPLTPEMRQRVDNMCKDMTSSVAALLGGSECEKLEKRALARLRETWTAQLEAVVSDWKWAHLCETAAATATGGGGEAAVAGAERAAVGGDCSPQPASPRMVGHRPKSMVVAAERVGEDEEGVSLERPPQPSALTHLAKSRPRVRRKAVDDVMAMSRSTELDEDTASTRSGDSVDSRRVPLSDRPVFRAAMLPEAALLSRGDGSPRIVDGPPSSPLVLSAIPPTLPTVAPPPPQSPTGSGGRASPAMTTSTTSIIMMSPTTSRLQKEKETVDETSPPPLPRRVKMAPPPMLPPKPRVEETRRTSPDDENANNRRSVADMARMFQR